MELLPGSEEGSQAPPATSPLWEAQRFPSCAAGQQRSPGSKGQAERHFHPAAQWLALAFERLAFLEMDSVYPKKITGQMSAPLNFFKFFQFPVQLLKTS